MFVFVKRIVDGLRIRRKQSGDILTNQPVFQHGAHLWAKFVGVSPAIHPAARSCVGKKGLDVRVYMALSAPALYSKVSFCCSCGMRSRKSAFLRGILLIGIIYDPCFNTTNNTAHTETRHVGCHSANRDFGFYAYTIHLCRARYLFHSIGGLCLFAEICRETAKAIGCENTRFHFYRWRDLRLAECYSPILCSHAAKQRGAIECGTET